MALRPSLEEEMGELFLQFLVKLWLLFVNSKTKTRNEGKKNQITGFCLVFH